MMTLKDRDYSEIFRLKELCENASITHILERNLDGYKLDVGFDDAIICCGSHGEEKGLLESFHANHCNGYETADEIFEKWKKRIDKFKN